MSFKRSDSNGIVPASEEQKAKIEEVRASLGPLPDKLVRYCTDDCIKRFLTARNWNVKKTTKMLKETLKWRLEYKPDEIRWEEIAHEAETGKIYRSNFSDSMGRCVLVMRPAGCQNTNSGQGQIKYLVYCLENAIFNLPVDQEQMVWLIDFHGFSLSNLSVKVVKETAHVLQDCYPERLGIAILYNPPKFFESFWTVVKPFLEPKTYRKVKFVYSDDPSSMKIMEQMFDMDKLETSFGGKSKTRFCYAEYAAKMREDDKRMPLISAKDEANLVPDINQSTKRSLEPTSSGNFSQANTSGKLSKDCNVGNEGKRVAYSMQS